MNKYSSIVCRHVVIIYAYSYVAPTKKVHKEIEEFLFKVKRNERKKENSIRPTRSGSDHGIGIGEETLEAQTLVDEMEFHGLASVALLLRCCATSRGSMFRLLILIFQLSGSF